MKKFNFTLGMVTLLIGSQYALATSQTTHKLLIEQGVDRYLEAPADTLSDIQKRIEAEVDKVCPKTATWRQVAHMKIEIMGQGDLDQGPLQAIHYPTFRVTGKILCR